MRLAMAIRGVRLVTAPEVTMPVTGLYLALDKTSKVPMLYIQHKTHNGPDAKVSYKSMPVITTNPGSLFSRLCKAAGVPAEGMKQRHAAKLLASAVASKGAIRATRVGKEHDWQGIKLVDFDTDPLPWHLPTRDGVSMVNLLEYHSESGASAEPKPPRSAIADL